MGFKWDFKALLCDYTYCQMMAEWDTKRGWGFLKHWKWKSERLENKKVANVGKRETTARWRKRMPEVTQSSCCAAPNMYFDSNTPIDWIQVCGGYADVKPEKLQIKQRPCSRVKKKRCLITCSLFWDYPLFCFTFSTVQWQSQHKAVRARCFYLYRKGISFNVKQSSASQRAKWRMSDELGGIII